MIFSSSSLLSRTVRELATYGPVSEILLGLLALTGLFGLLPPIVFFVALAIIIVGTYARLMLQTGLRS